MSIGHAHWLCVRPSIKWVSCKIYWWTIVCRFKQKILFEQDSTMSGGRRHLPYLILYIVSASLLSSRGATHWKLNEDGVVQSFDSQTPDVVKSDPILAILTKGFPNKEVGLRKPNCEACASNGALSEGWVEQRFRVVNFFMLLTSLSEFHCVSKKNRFCHFTKLSSLMRNNPLLRELI